MRLWSKIKQKLTPETDADIIMLKQLKKQGVDVSLTQDLAFSFDFSAAPNAETLAYALESKGFRTEFFQNYDASFTCLAKKSMVPDLDILQAMTVRFKELAIRMGGQYSGWELAK